MVDGVKYVSFIRQLCILVVVSQQPTRDGCCCGKFPAIVVPCVLRAYSSYFWMVTVKMTVTMKAGLYLKALLRKECLSVLLSV